MTDIEPGKRESGSDAAVQAATNDLEELRQLLVRASHSTAEPTEVKAALETYWSDHEDTLRTAANGLTEQVRLQTLDVLYKWRDQIGQQRAQRDGHDLSSDPPPGQ